MRLTNSLSALSLMLASSLLHAEFSQPAMDWVPPEAMSEGLRSDESSAPVLAIIETATPKSTSDATKFTKEYTLELEKFGIRNDGTQAVETTKGINAALQHAKKLEANRIIFPKGTYLIDEASPVILDHKNTIVDLNGATLQIQSNGKPEYSVVEIIDGAENLRLTNGTLRGDRDTHDFKTVKGTHEWGTALRVQGGRELEIDHLTLTNGAGDGIGTGATGSRNRDELLAMIQYSVQRKHLESGAFSDTGDKVDSRESIRTIAPFDLTKCGGAFELGYPGGHQGFPFIKGRIYEVLFLDANMKLIERRKVPQYRKTSIPEGTKFGHFQFNQSEVPEKAAHSGASDSWLVRITNLRPPTDVHFHNNVAIGNRRLGMAYCGGQKWVIESNRFDGNGGTNPAFGVDFEDGAELMQDVVFRNNTFEGNKAGDLVVCAGTELRFENNTFQKNVLTWGRPSNYIFRNNRFTGGKVIFSTRTGIAKFEGNEYSDCTLDIRFDTKAVADGIVRKPGQPVSTPALLFANESFTNVSRIEGTYLNFLAAKFRDSQLVAGEDTRLVSFDKCSFEKTTLELEEKGPEFTFRFKNNKGELPVSGPGLHRKLMAEK